MPSVAQINEGIPILTGFQANALKKSQSADNEHFQNEVRNNHHKRSYEADDVLHSTNGNGHAAENHDGPYVNGHENGIHNGNGQTSLQDEGDVVDAAASPAILTSNIIQMDQGLNSDKGRDLSLSQSGQRGIHTTATLATAGDPSLAWKLDGKVYNKGPDQIIPSVAKYTWHAEGATRIDVKPGELSDREPISVPTLLTRCVSRNPKKIALKVKRDGVWQEWTYNDYLHDVRTAAKGFIALGLERYHGVCILGFNAPEWFISSMGCIFAGGFNAGIYTTNNPEACGYCAIDSKANVFVVEDSKQLAKVLEIRHTLPHLKAIIQYSGEPTEPGVYSWSKFMLLGGQQPDNLLEERLRLIAINQCCTLIYTSGTTGNPKGVMLSHDNLSWMAQVNQKWANFREGPGDFQEVVISFLPLSHVAAQMADMYCPLTVGAQIAFADKNALKGTLVEDMKEILPTKFLAVPRVWEKMYEKITEVGRNTAGLKKIIAIWAKNKGLEYNMKRMNGVENPKTLGYRLANYIVLSKIRELLGLANCDLQLSGAAPISPDILKFFMSLNVVVTEAYGMSECSGPHCMATENLFRLGSVGKTMVGCTTKISNPDADGSGEILMGGRHVAMGYLNQEDKTRAAIDEEGWLHSEDIGKIDEDGYLFITGRLKELLITAGGENVAPVPIEDNIKSELPLVSQAVVLGDRLKFLSVLLTLKTEVDMNSQEPLDKLMRVTKDWVEKNGDCTVTTIQDVHRELYEKNNKKLQLAIQAGIDRANKRAVSQAQKIQKWVVLSKDFSIPGGELGPTLKLKRQVVYDKNKDTIAQLYDC